MLSVVCIVHAYQAKALTTRVIVSALHGSCPQPCQELEPDDLDDEGEEGDAARASRALREMQRRERQIARLKESDPELPVRAYMQPLDTAIKARDLPERAQLMYNTFLKDPLKKLEKVRRWVGWAG